jgi:hypothetical protein
MVHPTVYGRPYGRQTTSSSLATLDVAVSCGTRGAQELFHPMPTFLKANTYSLMVHPFACAFWKEEP